MGRTEKISHKRKKNQIKEASFFQYNTNSFLESKLIIIYDLLLQTFQVSNFFNTIIKVN